MKQTSIRETVQKIDARLERVEHILPTLATKAELREAIAEAIAPLATKAELQATVQAAAEETRRHMDVVSEATRYEVQLLAHGYKAVAESQRSLGERLDRSIEEIKGVLMNHEGRLPPASRLKPSRSG